MNVLVTGADGFAGSWLVRRLLDDGHEVVGAVKPGRDPRSRPLPDGVRRVPFDLIDAESVRQAARERVDAVVHLAAVASGADAAADPLCAWQVNAVGTACLATALGLQAPTARPLLLVASTAEVYGVGPATPRIESDPVSPCSPYAASKLGAEIAALEVHRRTGLRVVVTRAFPHTGPDQDDRFVVPAFAARIVTAKRLGAPAVKVGRLEAVRDLLDVSDVVDAYARLLTAGESGEVYNVAAGRVVSVRDVFDELGRLAEYSPIPEFDPHLVRPVDIPYLVGDSSKLRRVTGWTPRVSLEQTLRGVLDAQAH